MASGIKKQSGCGRHLVVERCPRDCEPLQLGQGLERRETCPGKPFVRKGDVEKRRGAQVRQRGQMLQASVGDLNAIRAQLLQRGQASEVHERRVRQPFATAIERERLQRFELSDLLELRLPELRAVAEGNLRHRAIGLRHLPAQRTQSSSGRGVVRAEHNGQKRGA